MHNTCNCKSGVLTGESAQVQNDCAKCDSCCAKILGSIKTKFPVIRWISGYSKKDGTADLIAGLTVGLTVVPQSIAYAAIAGLSPEYGLYSSYLGVFLYVLFGTCRQVTIGPTAVMALLTFQTCGENYPQCAVLTTFYAGILELLMASLRLGWLVSFISEPVTVGFTAAAATTIISSQLKSFLGISGFEGDGFVGYLYMVFQNFRTVNMGDTVMGISTFFILILLRKIKDIALMETTTFWNIAKRGVWVVSISRNALIVITTALIAYFWRDPPFSLVGNVHGGFPPVSPPHFLLPFRPNATGTYSENSSDSSAKVHSFSESLSILSTGPLVIALISILQNVAISKAFGSGQVVECEQEMLALGVVNFVGGFFSCIPTTGSFSRSAVNEASGVRSPMGGVYTGILVLLSLEFLTSSFAFIPKASLASVIITAVMFMVDYKALIPMWKISRVDFLSCIVTFFCCLFLGMEFGILIGVAVSLCGILLKTLRPRIKWEVKCDAVACVSYLFIEPENGLVFPSVDHINKSIQTICAKNKAYHVLVISFAKWNTFDYTAANTLATLAKGTIKKKKLIVFLDCPPEWVSVLQLAGLKDPPCVKSTELSKYLRENCIPTVQQLNVFVNFPKPVAGTL